MHLVIYLRIIDKLHFEKYNLSTKCSHRAKLTKTVQCEVQFSTKSEWYRVAINALYDTDAIV